ncbi:glutathione S-transferase family protein [Pendulispora brunnea]|uniref:Glutathione S-transferase family protein n=1 Tax=Pendulispora brunnea TaxID=2905690 RepID=A0ABZ2K706_9BACT
MLKLYGFAPTRSIRVLWMLRELGLEFEYVNVDLRSGEARRPEFLELNPAAKVPVLADGDLVLTESVAIVLYLAEKHPEKGFLPVELRERAEVHRWLLFTATELEQPLWRISKHRVLYPPEKRIAAEISNAGDDFKAMAAVLDEHMASRAFVAGSHVTVADFVLAYTLDWANEVQLLDTYPRLRDYMERMYRRPAAPPRIAQAFAGVPSPATSSKS